MNLGRALIALLAAVAPAGAQATRPPGWNPTDSIRQLTTYRPAHDTVTLLAPDRIARLAPHRADAWRDYLARSRDAHVRDTARMNAELRAVGRDTMSRAPYTPGFEVAPWMTPAWLASDSAQRMAESILSFQAPNGGWSKHVDFRQGTRQRGQSYFAETNAWAWISTFDNSSTTEELHFLARIDAVRPDVRHRAAFLRGLDHVLGAQMPNGCWPQSWPLEGSYHDAATFNDGVIVNVLTLLDETASGRYPFVPAAARTQARNASEHGLACILDTQVVVDGRRTIWGQQHDPLTLAPTSARSYELTSLTGSESVEIAEYLMRRPSPSARAVEAVHAAADWYRAHAIHGFTYEGSELRAMPGAGPLWPRLSEIGTNRPIFANRDGITLYDWDKLTDRRRGYGWFTTAPIELLQTYDRWAPAHPRK